MARHSKPVDIILWMLILCIALPVSVICMEIVAGLFGRKVRRIVHGVLVALLVAVVALPVLKNTFQFPGHILLAGAAISGIVTALLYLRCKPLKMFLTMLSPSILIFPLLFVFNSNISDLVFPEKVLSITATANVKTVHPIIMVVFDEFNLLNLLDEHRQIDRNNYPNLAAFAREAYWFREATTVSNATHQSLPTILTGNYPGQGRMPIAAHYPHSLYNLLGNSYTFNVFEPMTQLCPDQLCGTETVSFGDNMKSLLVDISVVYLHLILPQDLSENLPDITSAWKDFFSDPTESEKQTLHLQKGGVKKLAMQELKGDRVLRFERFIHSIVSTEKPPFYFLHAMLPHSPYYYLPSGKQYALDSGIKGRIKDKNWIDDVRAVHYAYQRYLLQVGLVDTLIGKLISHLKTIGMYDPSLIIITADHGVSFRPNDSRRKVTETNYMDIMSVPLFIKVPYQTEGVLSDRNVELIDILPTIADVLEVRLPWSVDGNSMFDTSLPERPQKKIYSRSTPFVFNTRFDDKFTVERKLALFGPEKNPYRLYQYRGYRSLIGKALRDVNISGTSDIEIHLKGEASFEHIDPEASFIPAQVQGDVFWEKEEKRPPINLAVAVNNVIYSITQTFEHKETKAKFLTIVPEKAFQKGKNAVDVLVVSGKNASIQMWQTKDWLAPAYSLVLSGEQDREIIMSSDQKTIPIIPNALKGYARGYTRVGSDRIAFAGWAADVKNSQVPDAILLFVNGEFFYSGQCHKERPGVAKLYGDALRKTGFNYSFPLSSFNDIVDPEIRIFALSKRGVASELSYHGIRNN